MLVLVDDVENSDFFDSQDTDFSNTENLDTENQHQESEHLEKPHDYIITKEEISKKEVYIVSRYSPYYFMGSLFNVSMQWVQNDCEESVRQITDFYYDHLFNVKLVP